MITTLVLAGLAAAPTMAQTLMHPGQGYHVDFESGADDWYFGYDPCSELRTENGNPGAHWNIARGGCEGFETPIVTGWAQFTRDLNPAQGRVFSNAMDGFRISVDINVNSYDLHGWMGPSPVEKYRKLVVEIRDLDNPYVDPETGYSWPWTAVSYTIDALPGRDEGWKTFAVDVVDPKATEMPEGWMGFGGPEDEYYMPQLPPDRTFADVIAGADQIAFTTLEPGWVYWLFFTHDLDIDNIRVEAAVKSCNAKKGTVYVDASGTIRGGELDGTAYMGTLVGTEGNDVIIGTDGSDVIEALAGNDVICSQRGDDHIEAGDGMDVIHAGGGVNTCLDGEVAKGCQE